MLRFLFVFSATPFSIYNPDNGKTRVVYQIGLVSHPNSGSPTWKVFTGSRRGHEISTTKSDWIFWSLARLIDLTKSQQTNKNSPCVNC